MSVHESRHGIREGPALEEEEEGNLDPVIRFFGSLLSLFMKIMSFAVSLTSVSLAKVYNF
jgi:hypothetical protein